MEVINWADIGQTALRGAILFGVIWVLAKAATDAVVAKLAEHKVAEKDAVIRQLEWDNLHYQDTRRELIVVKDYLKHEISIRKQAEARADDFYKQLCETYGRIRTAPIGDVNEGGAPMQAVA
jgi:hypothetical protein